MANFLEKMKQSKKDVSDEYQQVNANPIAKTAIQVIVMLIDIFVMFILMWNMFSYCIPYGSWINFVDGKSMYPTMNSGQIIFSDANGEVQRGDIITTYASDYAKQQDQIYEDKILVKRVIGIPGDRLIIKADGVYINGELYEETYLTDENKALTYVEGNINSVLLDDGEYFIMGDNRDESFDSRSFGIIKDTDILYRQSITPTTSFWLKTIFALLIFALDVFIYFLIEFIMTELAYVIFFNKKKSNNSDDAATIHQTTETVFLKGDKK